MAGQFYFNNHTELFGEDVEDFWVLLHTKYGNRIRDGTIVEAAENMGIKTILVETWLDKNCDIFFEKIPLVDDQGNFYLYQKEELDGWYYNYVYCKTLDILVPKIQEQQNNYRYFVNTLKKQGWEMSALFESNLINRGIFLARYRDMEKRIPYDFMKKLNIRMG
ncbi:hypothetical protein [Enterococcus sp. LJL51]|uniref:hypothetical protein n=1 Tax=Enterococcus sp. LJL51 TaxID=3416656 RepID=UPI003CFB8C84